MNGRTTFDGADEAGEPFDEAQLAEVEGLLREAALVCDPVPSALRDAALAAFALHDLDARLAELTFDSLVDAAPVRSAVEAPRMLTFAAGDLTVDVEVGEDGLLGQLLPPQKAGVEVLTRPAPEATASCAADATGGFSCAVDVTGPFALRVRTGDEVVVTEWLRV
ncbi:hypothetical protein [Streptomyces abyssomicinicus]|uniref:hypothetical protein n=1 Tax=Streptomyces abyssomicinicus TaxID=574929 RepID=UPI0012503EEF|nr:hypothetical protein [Streptomyces abyssomicinicus]